MTSSTKPEVVSTQRIRIIVRRGLNHVRPRATYRPIENFVKFEHVAFEIREQTGIQTDRQTYRHADHNNFASLPGA